tara:strand:+ start:375 stop:515 length:141 start_codon:yes stop_codon:yes gene_type:complete
MNHFLNGAGEDSECELAPTSASFIEVEPIKRARMILVKTLTLKESF